MHEAVLLLMLVLSTQSNEIGGSSHMEKEGLKRSMAFLQTSGLSVDTIITDRHPQIQKYLRENMPSVSHYYDVWHVAKGEILVF